MGLDLPNLLPSLEAKLQSRISSSTRVKFAKEVTVEAKQTIKVSEISDQPTTEGRILQSRKYEVAPIYVKVSCIEEIKCSLCNIPHRFHVLIYLPTASFARRQLEYYDKGQPRTLELGSVSLSLFDLLQIILGSVRTKIAQRCRAFSSEKWTE